jgi:hypothetical protein
MQRARKNIHTLEPLWSEAIRQILNKGTSTQVSLQVSDSIISFLEFVLSLVPQAEPPPHGRMPVHTDAGAASVGTTSNCQRPRAFTKLV